MFKELKKYQVSLTPFQASKTWNLNNIDNDDALLFESTGSDDGELIDLEYKTFTNTTESVNYSCQVALEQQEDDQAIYQEGLNLSGAFYPESDPQNANGTYKRVVHAQIKTTFYNDYRDPTKLLGLENIDFENSQTKRRLANRLRMFDIPTSVFGDKIVPATVTLNDTTLDNDYTITDDGYGNLFAQRNLFSNQQEIGQFTNSFSASQMSPVCNTYFGT